MTDVDVIIRNKNESQPMQVINQYQSGFYNVKVQSNSSSNSSSDEKCAPANIKLNNSGYMAPPDKQQLSKKAGVVNQTVCPRYERSLSPLNPNETLGSTNIGLKKDDS